MNVMSLFDGMCCGQLAFKKAGIQVDNYYASEIDKHAIKVSSANWPHNINLGDVTKWKEWDVDWSSIDVLIGGSPCQGFSFAGKRLAFDDPRSVLFFKYVEILDHIKKLNPNVKFMLENVKMKKQSMDVITRYLEVEPIHINSDVISGCSRPRNYWCNFDVDEIDPIDVSYLDFIDQDCMDNEMSDGFHKWWNKNKEKQSKSSYSKIVKPGEKGVCMTARQYASWSGNFIELPTGRLRKPTKDELALLVGAPKCYFDACSQRQAEVMTGNGWTVDVIAHIFKSMIKNKERKQELLL